MLRKYEQKPGDYTVIAARRHFIKLWQAPANFIRPVPLDRRCHLMVYLSLTNQRLTDRRRARRVYSRDIIAMSLTQVAFCRREINSGWAAMPFDI